MKEFAAIRSCRADGQVRLTIPDKDATVHPESSRGTLDDANARPSTLRQSSGQASLGVNGEFIRFDCVNGARGERFFHSSKRAQKSIAQQQLGTFLVSCLVLTSCLDFNEATQFCLDAGYCKPAALEAPTVTKTVPANGAKAGVNDAIVITFSRAMAIDGVTVTLTPPDALAPPIWDDLHSEAVFLPAAPLRFTTSYTVRVNGAAEDNRAALKEHTFTFMTGEAPDKTPPTLVSSTPATGAMNVALNATLQLDFSEPIDQKSLSIVSNPPRDFGAATWMTNGQTVRFLSPSSPFNASTDYTLAIDAVDLAGNPLSGTGSVLFSTQAPADSSPPTVVSMSPPAMSTGISTNANISLSFSEPVKSTVVQAFTLSPSVAGMTCALDVAGVLMTCTHPSTLLASSQSYNIRLRTGADGGTGRTEDLAGNLLADDFTASFMTGAMEDVTPPTVMSVTPANMAQGQAYYPKMVVTFSEPMDKAATQAAIQVSTPNGVTGTYSWDMTGKVVTMTPNAPTGGFAPGTTFNWQVGTGAKDLAGKSLVTTQQYTFKVRRQITTTLTAQSFDGYLRESGKGIYTSYTSYAYTYVGDNSIGDAFKTFLFFDLSAANGVPKTALGILSAKLEISIYARIGDPSGVLGGAMKADAIAYNTTLSSTSWSATPIPMKSCGFLCFETYFLNDAAGRQSTSVRSYVEQALADQKLLFRLQYPKDEAGTASDYVGIRTSEWTTASERPTLQVTYEGP